MEEAHKQYEAGQDERVYSFLPFAENGDEHNHNRDRGKWQEDEKALAHTACRERTQIVTRTPKPPLAYPTEIPS